MRIRQHDRAPDRADVLLSGAICLVFLASCAPTKVSDTAPAAVNLSGSWVLNESLSTDMRSAVTVAVSEGRDARLAARERIRGMRPGGCGGSFGGIGEGSRSGDKDYDGSAGQDEDLLGQLDELVDVFSPSTKQLFIEQTATDVLVRYGSHREYRYPFGEELKATVVGYEAEHISGWQDQQFVVETEWTNGPKVIERFSLGLSGGQMQVTLTLESRQLPDAVTVTRVYDRDNDAIKPDESIP